MSITINHQTNALTATSGNITVNDNVPGPALVSGTTIKTVNGVSVLGSGDLVTGDVTLAGTQTLTNKTIDYGFNTLRSEEHTSELQSRFGISYAVFCLKTKKYITHNIPHNANHKLSSPPPHTLNHTLSSAAH